MSNFKAKMHQIWFLLRLHPRARWKSLHCSSDCPTCIWGGLLLKGGRGEWKKKKERGSKGGKRRRRRRIAWVRHASTSFFLLQALRRKIYTTTNSKQTDERQSPLCVCEFLPRHVSRSTLQGDHWMRQHSLVYTVSQKNRGIIDITWMRITRFQSYLVWIFLIQNLMMLFKL